MLLVDPSTLKHLYSRVNRASVCLTDRDMGLNQFLIGNSFEIQDDPLQPMMLLLGSLTLQTWV
jgi:hypothetical protein